jgi:hypothetical protein
MRMDASAIAHRGLHLDLCRGVCLIGRTLRRGAFNTAAQCRKTATASISVRWRHGKDAAVAVDLGEVVARTEDEIGLKVWLRVNPPDFTVQNTYDRARAGQLSLSIKADPDACRQL